MAHPVQLEERRDEMKITSLLSLLAIGLVSLLLSSPDASAAGFIHKTVQCPKTGFSLIPPGDRIEIDDIVVSADGATDVQLFFNPPKFAFMTLYLDANETVVTNFQGQVESLEEQGVKVTCGGVALVSVTIVGTLAGF
jgi:hypothetical protein